MANLSKQKIIIVGAGLAGSEAAYQVAKAGFNVELYEMRPFQKTGAHTTDKFAELICSNSLGSNLPDRASGILKNELRKLDSLLLRIADECSVPAGGALAVDREMFSEKVTRYLSNHPNIEVKRQEVTKIPLSPTIIASGPLTSDALSQSILELTGADNLFFYDAIAPIVEADSINMEIAYKKSRYQTDNEGSDYINCPLTKEQYEIFIKELIAAEKISLRDFENQIDSGVKAGKSAFFERCLPIEVLADRGPQTLAFGPMRPVGLRNPHTDLQPYAVLQLRQDNLAGTLYNLVGFQTNIKFSEQRRIFRLIPGLENAFFSRYGQMHRNTYIAAPLLLSSSLQYKSRLDLFFAGQITGIEGYVGNIFTGLVAGLNLCRHLSGKDMITFPRGTIIGSLLHYIANASLRDFQPMKANFGILPPVDEKNKKIRGIRYAQRSMQLISDLIINHELNT